jgi:hypothetical protein
MQKISSYLYPNRIELTADLTTHPTEWRIVYQRRYKVYKGFKNDLLLDIKNAEQKRINISDKTVKFIILDQNDQEIYTATAVHSSTPGLATISIPPTTFTNIKPQFLKYAVYILNNDATKTPIYGDTQFGLGGTLELIQQGTVVALPDLIIDVFNYYDDITVAPTIKKYISEAALINPPNDISVPSIFNFDFELNNLDGTIIVQLTKDSVAHITSNWEDIETFNVTNSTSTLTKTYTVSNDYIWARVYLTMGPDATGKIDKVTIRR